MFLLVKDCVENPARLALLVRTVLPVRTVLLVDYQALPVSRDHRVTLVLREHRGLRVSKDRRGLLDVRPPSHRLGTNGR